MGDTAQNRKAPNPDTLTDKEQDAEKKTVEALDSGDASEVKRALKNKFLVSDEETKDAVKAALDSDGNVKTDDEDRIIGLDGENPVSNENPDPRVVRGIRFLA